MSRYRQPLFLLLAIALIVSTAHAQIIQQGSVITGPGSGAALGTSVSLSADGNLMAIGAPTYGSGGPGMAIVYSRSAGVWSAASSFLQGSTAATNMAQGSAVALSGDGSTLAVGADMDSSGVGAVWIFTHAASGWQVQGGKLRGSGFSGASKQGFSVALSADGNTLAVGAPNDASTAGAVWVFTRSGTAWSQQGAKLVGTGGSGVGDRGYSVALSADGNTLLVGAPVDAGGNGAAWVYTRSAGTWSQQGGKLLATGLSAGSQFGISSALSADGNTAAIGANDDNAGLGATLVFTRSGSTWTQQGAKLVGPSQSTIAWQGISTALSADGNTLVVGESADLNGGVLVFGRTAGSWSLIGDRLSPTGGVNLAAVGQSVAVSADGNTLAIGGPTTSIGDGACWTFVRPAPQIVSVTDVPADQGGYVNLRWRASVIDYTPADPVSAYGIWRQVPAATAARALRSDARALRTTVAGTSTYYWEYLGSEPAHGFTGYSYTAATTSDSVAGANPRTAFMVEAQQSALGIYWPSAPDSGYSIDNLAPVAPAPFSAAYAAGTTQLAWSPNTEADLAGYRLYRGNWPGFVPSAATLIGTFGTATTHATDVLGHVDAYKLTAIDVHGNESAPSVVVPSGTTDVPRAAPDELALDAPSPNPVRGTTHITFVLPREGDVSLAVFDTGGRRVRTLVSGTRAAGAYMQSWDLRDETGRRVGAGVYFVRLAAGDATRIRRLAALE